MAMYVEGTGPGPYEGGHVQVLGSGKVLVSTGLTSQGQGHETAFAQIVASELGVPIEDIEVTTGDTRRFGYAVGTFASRAAVMSGNAIALAARGVREKALRIAADVLEVDPADLEIDEGVVQVKGTPGASIPLRTVAVLSNPLRYAFDEAAKQATQFARPGSTTSRRWPVGDAPGLEHRDYYSPIRSTFASGAHAAIVEIDPTTWEIDVVKYAVVHDCGNVVNPMIVEGQVHGGVAQGVGGALYERMAYDKDGQLQNASFMDFLMPYASEVPDIDIDHQETPSPLNPLGIKGAGEAGVIPGTAAIASAIEDAVGRRIAAMPISPTELYDLMRTPTRNEPRRPSPRRNRSDGVNLDGSAVLHADPDQVWSVITDPAVLARTIPGCESLEQVGDDEYKMNVTVGVGAIRGTYAGEVKLTDQQRPASYVMHASGAGGPGNGGRR